MQKLAENHQERVIDLLMGRMTFERAAVRLYDSILMKLQTSEDAFVAGLIGPMQTYRDQEYEHASWLETQVEALGGDPSVMTDLATLVQAELKGIMEVVLENDMSASHMFHALLVAELIDNTGWELLLELADDADDDVARREFRKRAHQEQDHLAFVRQTVVALMRKLVLGQHEPIPKAA